MDNELSSELQQKFAPTFIDTSMDTETPVEHNIKPASGPGFTRFDPMADATKNQNQNLDVFDTARQITSDALQKVQTDISNSIFVPYSDKDLFKTTENNSLSNLIMGDYTNRYPLYVKGADNEDINARNQSTASALLNGTGQLIFNAIPSFMGYFATIPKAVSATVKGDVDELWKTAFDEAVYENGEASRNFFAVYEKAKTTNDPSLMGALGEYFQEGTAASRWGSFLGNLGYTVGTIGAVAAEGYATRWAGGTGIARAGKAAFSSLANLFKGIRNIDRVSDTLSGATSLARTVDQAYELGQGARQLSGLQKAGKAAATTMKFGVRTAMATIGESAVEANSAYHEYMNDEAEAFKKNYGFEPSKEAMAKISTEANKVGDATFKMNAPILAVSNAVQFYSLIKTGRLFGKIGNEVAENWVLNTAKNAFVTPYTLAKEQGKKAVLKYGAKQFYKGVKAALPEGGEEISQTLASASAKRYYSLYKSPNTDNWLNTASAVAGEEIESGRLYQDFWAGFLTGGLTSAAGKVSRIVRGEAKIEQEKLDQFNKAFTGDNLAKAAWSANQSQLEYSTTIGAPTNKEASEMSISLVNNMRDGAIQSNLQTEIDAASIAGDSKKYHDFRQESLSEIMTANAMYGKEALGKEMFNQKIDDFDNKDYAEHIMGNAEATEAEVKQHKEKTKINFAEKQDKHSKIYGEVTTKYKNPFDPTKNPNEHDSYNNVIKDVVFFAAASDDSFGRAKTLSEELDKDINDFREKTNSDRLSKDDIYAITSVAVRYRQMVKLEDQLKTLDFQINSTEDENLKKSLNEKRAEIIKEFKLLSSMAESVDANNNTPTEEAKKKQIDAVNNWLEYKTGEKLGAEHPMHQKIADNIELENEGAFFLNLYNIMMGSKQAFDIYRNNFEKQVRFEQRKSKAEQQGNEYTEAQPIEYTEAQNETFKAEVGQDISSITKEKADELLANEENNYSEETRKILQDISDDVTYKPAPIAEEAIPQVEVETKTAEIEKKEEVVSEAIANQEEEARNRYNEKVNFLNNNNGNEVIINGNTGILTKINDDRFELETEYKIYEYSIDDINTYGELPIKKEKYEISNISESEVNVNGVDYNINVDKNGNIESVSPKSNTSQKIKNERLIIAVEIERNRIAIANDIQNEDIKETTVTDAMSEIGADRAKATIEYVFGTNYNDTIDEALEKLYNEDFLNENEKFQLSLWLYDAFDRLQEAMSKKISKTELDMLNNAYDNLETISSLLYGQEIKQTTKKEKNGKNKNATVADIKQSSERVKRRSNSENKRKERVVAKKQQSKPIPLQEQEESKQIDVQNKGVSEGVNEGVNKGVNPTSLSEINIGDTIKYEGENYIVTSKNKEGQLKARKEGTRDIYVESLDLEDIESYTPNTQLVEQRQSTSDTLSKADQNAIQKIMDEFMPNVVKVSEEEYNRIISENDVQETPFGFVFQGKVYINPRKETLETRMHEYMGHIFMAQLKENNPALYNSTMDRYGEIPQSIKDQVSQNYPELSENSEAFKDEVLATYIGQINTQGVAKAIKSSGLKSDIARILNRLYQKILKTLGMKDYMSLDNFNNKTLVEALTYIGDGILNGNITSNITSKEVARMMASSMSSEELNAQKDQLAAEKQMYMSKRATKPKSTKSAHKTNTKPNNFVAAAQYGVVVDKVMARVVGKESTRKKNILDYLTKNNVDPALLGEGISQAVEIAYAKISDVLKTHEVSALANMGVYVASTNETEGYARGKIIIWTKEEGIDLLAELKEKANLEINYNESLDEDGNTKISHDFSLMKKEGRIISSTSDLANKINKEALDNLKPDEELSVSIDFDNEWNRAILNKMIEAYSMPMDSNEAIDAAQNQMMNIAFESANTLVLSLKNKKGETVFFLRATEDELSSLAQNEDVIDIRRRAAATMMMTIFEAKLETEITSSLTNEEEKREAILRINEKSIVQPIVIDKTIKTFGVQGIRNESIRVVDGVEVIPTVAEFIAKNDSYEVMAYDKNKEAFISMSTDKNGEQKVSKIVPNADVKKNKYATLYLVSEKDKVQTRVVMSPSAIEKYMAGEMTTITMDEISTTLDVDMPISTKTAKLDLVATKEEATEAEIVNENLNKDTTAKETEEETDNVKKEAEKIEVIENVEDLGIIVDTKEETQEEKEAKANAATQEHESENGTPNPTAEEIAGEQEIQEYIYNIIPIYYAEAMQNEIDSLSNYGTQRSITAMMNSIFSKKYASTIKMKDVWKLSKKAFFKVMNLTKDLYSKAISFKQYLKDLFATINSAKPTEESINNYVEINGVSYPKNTYYNGVMVMIPNATMEDRYNLFYNANEKRYVQIENSSYFYSFDKGTPLNEIAFVMNNSIKNPSVVIDNYLSEPIMMLASNKIELEQDNTSNESVKVFNIKNREDINNSCK